jgi:signal peptidase I
MKPAANQPNLSAFKLTGKSMLPTLKPNTWIVIQVFHSPSELNTLQLGDLVLIKSSKSTAHALHRIIRLEKNRLQTSGDNTVFPDEWIPHTQVKGVAILSRDPSGVWRQERQFLVITPIFIKLARIPRFRLSRFPQMVLTEMINRKRLSLMKTNKSIEWHRVGEEIIVYNHHTDELYTLNETASFIWTCLTEGKERNTILKELLARYDISDSDQQLNTLETELDFVLSDFITKSLM